MKSTLGIFSVVEFIKNSFIKNLQVYSTGCTLSLLQKSHLLMNQTYTKYLFYSQIDQVSICKKLSSISKLLFLVSPTKISFINNLNPHKELFLQSNLSAIDLHNFIIVKFCFFEVYRDRCKFDIKSLSKLK